MTRLSPAVTRTVAVLNFFADHPDQSFTLTDIVRALPLSRATCHALLAALAESGYLYRNNDKSYMLGPAAARLGSAAQRDARPLQAAVPEMRQLADTLDVICSAVFIERGEAVVRERASSFSHLGWATRLGRRFPLHPPFGAVFKAWSAPAEIEAWLSRVEGEIDPDARAHALASLEFPRRHGFSFGLRTEHLRGDQHAQSLVYRADKTDYMGGDLRPGESYDLAFVAAPIFDAEGEVAFVLALMGFVVATSATEVETIGTRLCEACDRVTGFIGGKRPRREKSADH